MNSSKASFGSLNHGLQVGQIDGTIFNYYDDRYEEERCHQLFRLTTSGGYTTYEWYKSRVAEMVEDTCLWFLQHEHFQEWLKKESGPLLVTADPGCGKSVLAKYLIDHGLPRSETICYFFFKDKDQDTIRQALCAILHQLFSKKPSLIKHALPRFRENGQSLINSTGSLWEILQDAIRDTQAGPVIIILDAIDECAGLEFADLMRNIVSQFLGPSRYGQLKYLLTCRPYEHIVSKFHNLLAKFPKIHIPGEQQSDIIIQEVNRVITYRVAQLSKAKNLPPEIKRYLEERLQQTTHRTYLWVCLIFEYLEKTVFTKTIKGIEIAIMSFPETVDEAYEQILSQALDGSMCYKALCIILAASQPLTLSEMNIAININHKSKSIHDLDLQDERDFARDLRSWCGLFISIHHNRVYLLHQTAREFLLRASVLPTAVSPERWHQSISGSQAHAVLAEACVRYLACYNSDVRPPIDANREADDSLITAFLDYSAKNWGAHFREAGIVNDNDAMIPFTLSICDPKSKSYALWFSIYWKSCGYQDTKNFTALMVASYLGHPAIVKLVLDNGADIEARDDFYGQTPLSWAAAGGHEATVKLLLDNGADVETKGNDGKPPLVRASMAGHEAAVKPLLCATKGGHEPIVRLLLNNGNDVKANETVGRKPPSWGTAPGHEATVKLLLDSGADVDANDEGLGGTPLLWATLEATVRLLLDDGADIKANDNASDVEVNDDSYSRTPLSWAAEHGHEATVELLLESGADVESRDGLGRTPLSWAAERGRDAAVNLLLDSGADVEARDSLGRTPLSWAAECGHDATIKLLLDNGANVEPEDGRLGRTPLSWATERGHDSTVKLLLNSGADVEADDGLGRTPLSWVAERGHKTTVNLLLNSGANVEARDGLGRTPLSWAAERGHEATVNLLLNSGADVDSNDAVGRGPLSWAAKGGHEATVKLLLDSGADVKAHDVFHTTPLSWAAEGGHEATVELLLESGADVNTNDGFSQTPLSWDAEAENEAIVKLRLDKGANVRQGQR